MPTLTKTVDYWSHSQLQTFLECPLAYYEIYFRGADRMPPNIYMIYGTAIHHALAINFKAKIDTKKDLDLGNIVTEFNYMFDLQVEENKIPKEEMLDSFKLSAENSLAYYMENIAPSLQPKCVEQKFEIPLKNFPIKILAYIDLITEDGLVVDFKTAGKDWARQYTSFKLENDYQLTLYAAIYRKSFKTKEKGVRFDIFPRNSSQVHVKTAKRTQTQILNLLELITMAERVIQAGVFSPNLFSCSRCPFNKTCKKIPIINK